MNFLDKAIAAISPEWAAQRVYYRSILEQWRRYDAAKVTRRTDGWMATGGSANSETGPALDRLRYRSRDLARNNPYAARIFRALPSHIVGQGFMMRAADASGKQVKKNWQTFTENSDGQCCTNFFAQVHLAVRTIVEAGEVLLVWRPQASTDVPLQVEVLEPDYLDTGKTEARGENMVIQGVEFDAQGKRVAYWLFDNHPGEVLLRPGSDAYKSKRVSADLVDHVFDVMRPGQVRGIPWLAPAALRLRDLDEYEDAELMRKKIEACFAVFVRRVGGASTVSRTETNPSDPTGAPLERVTPGMIQYLDGAEGIEMASPSPSGGIGEYLKGQLHAIAAGSGVTYSMLTGDLAEANYSSLREGKLEFWQSLDHWQWHMLVPMLCQPAWRRVHEAYARVGKGPKKTPELRCAMPKRPWVDPDKDGKAMERDLRMGRITYPQMVNEAGHDPDEQLDEINKYRPLLEAAKLDFGSKQNAKAGKGNGDANTAD